MSGIALRMSSPKRQKSLSAAELRGVRLKFARNLLGLSQAEVAARLGVSRQTVSGWENGAEIEEERMDDVSRVVGASRGWIRYAEGPPPATNAATFEQTEPLADLVIESPKKRKKNRGS
jgi:transcriptional regulator with XRE-family HTH domain